MTYVYCPEARMYPGAHALTRPDHPAVVMGDGARLTYRELDERSVRLARWLHEAGLRPGDGIALLSENHERYFEVAWAALRSGLYVTPLNRHSTPAEATFVLADSGARALISSYAMRETATVVSGQVGLGLMYDGVAPGFSSYEDALAGVSSAPLADEPRGQTMIYSSGTTGRPKGIRRPLHPGRVDDPQAVRPSWLARSAAAMTSQSVYLVPSPLYHSAGLVWALAAQELGATVVVMEQWDPERLLALIAQHRVTHTQLVPTMMIRLLKLPAPTRERHDLSSLQRLLHAAAPCPVEIKHQMIDWLGPVVDEYYSGTEGIGVTWISAPQWLEHPGSVGRAIDGVLHICDDDGAELRAGEVGAVFFERPTPAFSYHNDAAGTRAARHPTHPTWLTIGDLGRVDEEGYLYLTDRKAFMIISGGVNIYPAEIEGAMVTHPGVSDVAVFGVPDPDMGQQVHAVVQPAAGVEPDDELRDSLLAHAAERLSRFKVPRTLEFVPLLPRTESGKLNKDTLRAQMARQRD